MRFAAVHCMLAAILLAGCVFSPTKADLRPQPPPVLDPPLPISVGVYYPPETRSYRYVAEWNDQGIFELGPPTMSLFDSVFSRMFANVLTVTQRPPLAAGTPAVDAVIELAIADFIPSLITYRVTAYTADGTELESWLVTGSYHPEQASGIFGSSTEEITSLAMRDAAEYVVAEFSYRPGIRRWLEQRGIKLATSAVAPPSSSWLGPHAPLAVIAGIDPLLAG